jgi:GGDEF domain-containing protein
VTDKNQSQIDLEQLVAQIKQQDSEFDAIQQAYPELRRVFDVVSDIAQQKKQKVHLLLFTISYQDGDKMSVEEQERVMEYLERAVITSMEVDDFTTRYSGSQRIVVLSDKSKEQVDAVTSHIMKEFYKMYDRKEMSVSYQVADLSE